MRYQISPITFLLIVGFSILFCSCSSSEIGITSPSIEQVQKTISNNISLNKINTKDTLVYLPLSKKTLRISKDLSAKQIALLDKYLTNHEIPTNNKIITPMLEQCGTHTVYGWVYGDKYTPVAGKNLGIWTNYESPAQCHDYGFNSLFISGDATSVNSVITAATPLGFNTDNLMIGLSRDDYLYDSVLIANTYAVGKYHIDEPFEHGAFNWNILTTFTKLSNLIFSKNSNAKLLIAGYYDPNGNICCNWNSYSSGYQALLGLPHNNIFVMCDEYHGNCCGTVDDYWNIFGNYFGTTKNFSNWLSVTANNGDGNTHVDCFYINSKSNSWYDLLGHANRAGMNEVWLYALGTGNDQGIKNFSYTAWQLGWLLRQRKYVVVFWQCDTYPCRTYCQWPSESGDGWYVSGFYYTGAEDYIPFNY